MSKTQAQIAQDIVESRKFQGISQRELARRANTTQAVISRIENQEVNPSVGLIERLSSALGQNMSIHTSPTVEKIKHKLTGEYHTLNNIYIDSDALTHNYNFFQKANPQAQIAPVLKSNAYGHGLVEVGEWVDQNLKVPFICVDSLFEAYRLKKRGVKTPVLVIGYTDPKNFAVFSDLSNIHFAAFDLNTIQALTKYQSQAAIHIKIDTGMNRLGILPHQIPEFIDQLKHTKVNITGIYSHLSQADSENTSFTKQQVKTLKKAIHLFESSKFRFTYKHIAATAGSFLTKDPEFNLIRLGLGLYGYSPFQHNLDTKYQGLDHQLKPALSLTTKLIQIKQVREGSQISYGGSYVTTKPTTIGILPIGYYDGVSRKLSNRGVVRLHEKACPILGKVTMNLTIIDITGVPNAGVGDTVEVISPDISQPNSIYNLAKVEDNIPYEVLTTTLSETTKRTVV